MPPAIVINLFGSNKDPLLFKMASEFEGEPNKAYVFAHGEETFPAIVDSRVTPPCFLWCSCY